MKKNNCNKFLDGIINNFSHLWFLTSSVVYSEMLQSVVSRKFRCEHILRAHERRAARWSFQLPLNCNRRRWPFTIAFFKCYIKCLTSLDIHNELLQFERLIDLKLRYILQNIVRLPQFLVTHLTVFIYKVVSFQGVENNVSVGRTSDYYGF